MLELAEQVDGRFSDHRARRVDLLPPRGVSSDGRTCSLRCARAGTPKPCSLRFAPLRAAGLPGTGWLRVGAFARAGFSGSLVAHVVHRRKLRRAIALACAPSARQISRAPRAAHKSRHASSRCEVERLAHGMPSAPWVAKPG